VEKNVDLIIPSLYEYTLEHIGKVYPAIPSPLNTDSIKYSENRVKGKIVFMHGINRELAKGTPYIRESLQRLAQKYPNDVEVIMEGHLPLNEYIQFMNRANVLVDQCMGYGYGINATIGMAQGKIVMAGARPETLHAMHVDTCPIIHIQPDVDQIFSQMEWIVQNRSHITEMGEKSRLFVEEYHDCKKVAQQYIDAWKSTGKI
jgi:glycosyltransferase involved in cell wall biosynthesis